MPPKDSADRPGSPPPASAPAQSRSSSSKSGAPAESELRRASPAVLTPARPPCVIIPAVRASSKRRGTSLPRLSPARPPCVIIPAARAISEPRNRSPPRLVPARPPSVDNRATSNRKSESSGQTELRSASPVGGARAEPIKVERSVGASAPAQARVDSRSTSKRRSSRRNRSRSGSYFYSRPTSFKEARPGRARLAPAPATTRATVRVSLRRAQSLSPSARPSRPREPSPERSQKPHETADARTQTLPMSRSEVILARRPDAAGSARGAPPTQ